MTTILNYEGFEPYLHDWGSCWEGVQYIFKFENSYGASIVKHNSSYGHERDLWELAVIKFYSTEEWGLVYDTEITDDVEGWLTDTDVKELLARIKGL